LGEIKILKYHDNTQVWLKVEAISINTSVRVILLVATYLVQQEQPEQHKSELTVAFYGNFCNYYRPFISKCYSSEKA
jgi:hypothetical protein